MSVTEAKKLMKEGDEALKTGLFKWQKDYASALTCYDEAAKLFRIAKDFNNAMKAYEKCIPVNEKMNDPWAVARNCEAIATMSMERTDGVKPTSQSLIEWTTRAGRYFRMANSHSTYIGLVKKVGKYMEEQNNANDAIEIYKILLNNLEEDEQNHLQSDILPTVATLFIKLQKFAECVDLFEKEFVIKKTIMEKNGTRQNLDSLALTIISLYLIMGKIDAAEKRLQDFTLEIRDFIKTPELDVCEKMLEAYIDGNQEEFKKNSERSVLNNIFPLNIIKELRKVKVKAMPNKKKVINIDDLPDRYDVPETKYEKPATNLDKAHANLFADDDEEPTIEKASQQTAPIIVNEEQRQKDLDDFIN